MRDLFSSQFNPSTEFQRAGIDFADPINTKCQHKRNSTTVKSCICHFICMSIKSAYIELVLENTTEAFLFTLRSFISSQGCSADIYHNSSKTFVVTVTYLTDYSCFSVNQKSKTSVHYTKFLTSTEITT